jgi:Flp pilus assembly protein TadD
MAEEEEIVIIEDSEAASVESIDNEESKEIDEASLNDEKKKKILIFGAAAIALIIIIAAVLIIAIIKHKKEKKHTLVSTTSIEKKLEQSNHKKIKPSKLEDLIAKANYLYTTGSKQQALELYEYIAQYSEAISQYNLGVARLKNKQYQLALESFNNAINNGEKRCVSAINAAVCCIYLNKKEDFKYFIDLAEAYLPQEANSVLYPYYYALVKFYHQNYFEALAGIDKLNHNEYIKKKKYLQTKLYTLFNDDYDALDAIDTLKKDDLYYSKGLLYARVGELSLAKENFLESISKGYFIKESKIALTYTNIKLGELSTASEALKKIYDDYSNDFFEQYPINVYLKKSLFNPIKAQKVFRDDLKNNESIIFQKLFYFSPYKIFNANQTINYIRKGNATSYIDSIDSAKTFLKKSATTSSVNKGIAKAIKKALNFKIREANDILKSLLKIQPKHSILHYDLALTYAQLGNMKQAYKHFLISFHMDAKNYLAGIYAYMCSKLIKKENKKLLSIIKESIILEDENEKTNFLKTLLYVVQDHYYSANDWLYNKYKPKPLYLALKNIIAMKSNKYKIATKSAKELVAMLPNEILPHIMYIDAKLSKEDFSTYAKESIKYLKKQKFNYKDLFYGPFITRYLFIRENLICGKLYTIVEILKKELGITNQKYIVDIEYALALALLYNQQFEESYVYFNHLIDELHVRDAKTLFLGAVAAIAAKHHPNAIALLELSKLKDKTFFETRFALALLYMEVKNAEAASIEFGYIKKSGFKSKYFNFDIDLKKLTFNHQHQTK